MDDVGILSSPGDVTATADASSLANTRSTERSAVRLVVMLATASHAVYSEPTAAAYADVLPNTAPTRATAACTESLPPSVLVSTTSSTCSLSTVGVHGTAPVPSLSLSASS